MRCAIHTSKYKTCEQGLKVAEQYKLVHMGAREILCESPERVATPRHMSYNPLHSTQAMKRWDIPRRLWRRPMAD